MTALSPPLFMAGLQQFADEAALAPAEDLRLYWSGRCPADIEFVHRVGMASHRDPVCQLTHWPLRRCESAEELVAFAERNHLSTVLPAHGDLVVVNDADHLLPGRVGMVLRVIEFGGVRTEGPTKVQLTFAEPDEQEQRRMRYAEVTRWCGPSRGDVIVRWADLVREAA